MNASATLCIVTPRLLVRDWADGDLAGVRALRSDPRATRFMGFAPQTPEESRAWLDDAIEHNGRTPRRAHSLGIARRSDQRLIGWIGIGRSERDRTVGTLGLGYMLHGDHHGQGYMTEAAGAVVEFGFSVLGAQRAGAWCYAENQASARVLWKLGMVLQRRYWDVDPASGQLEECLELSVGVEDWLAGSPVRR